MLQPSPAARLEDRLYEHLDWPAPLRPHAHDVLGDQMTQAGLEMGTNTPYGTALLRCGEAQKQLSEAQRHFVQSTNIHFLTPLRRFSGCEYKAIQDERRMLLNKRLDLDIAKSRLRRAHEAEQESRTLNSNQVENDYLSHMSYMLRFVRVRWLKMWAQEISQAEMELRIFQSLFDRQSEVTRQLLGELNHTHSNHMQSLTDFVDAQTCYYAQCKQHALELQKQLASIPAVLCSSKWQSSITNGLIINNNEASADKQAAGLNHVSPVSVVVHHLPEFDQDSWTAEAAAAAPAPEEKNNNNSNNTQGPTPVYQPPSCHQTTKSGTNEDTPDPPTLSRTSCETAAVIACTYMAPNDETFNGKDGPGGRDVTQTDEGDCSQEEKMDNHE
ncbi:endophilin-B1-like isoform X2 [Dunckerocampus dactyliophorus]|nr:endophilin-B1-like isoform X2 [Dunckerocampus dactyliophorus]